MAVASAHAPGGADRPWRILFVAAVVLGVLGVGTAIAALVTDDWILDANPCASAGDHPLAWLSVILLAGTWGASFVLLGRGLARTHTPTLIRAASLLVSLVFFTPLSLLIMAAGYGWRCPL